MNNWETQLIFEGFSVDYLNSPQWEDCYTILLYWILTIHFIILNKALLNMSRKSQLYNFKVLIIMQI